MQECFLCALDPRHSCAVRQLEGRIVATFERMLNGEKTPIIIIDTGTTRAELHLTDYYRKFVKELYERGIVVQNLILRLYHLPTPPHIGEYKGQPRHVYHTNSYTLAVLEPDTLLNITDLNHAEYCSRQYLLHNLIPSTTSAATIRGNLVHHCFKELLKEHDRGELMKGHADKGQETPLATLHRHFEQALEQSSIELALANVSIEEIRADVAPHLESLATWYQNQSATLWDMPAAQPESLSRNGAAESDTTYNENLVRAETFLLAPEIGLRGRLDLLWQQSNRQRLLELKTGGGSDNLPRSNHRWQVYGYHALLTVRRDPKMQKARGTLLYSGTPGEAQAFGIEPTIRDIQRVNETRNILVLSHITGIPSAPPGPSRCTRCAMLNQCEQVSSLLGWQPPEVRADEQVPGIRSLPNRTGDHKGPPNPTQPRSPLLYNDTHPVVYSKGGGGGEDGRGPLGRPRWEEAGNMRGTNGDSKVPFQTHEAMFTEEDNQIKTMGDPRVPSLPHPIPAPTIQAEDRAFFAKYYNLLQIEGREGERQQALLWKNSVAERIERGTAISDLQPHGSAEPTGQGEWEQEFVCTNTSELREGDEILLSDGDPITGEVVTGTIKSISAEHVRIWSPELIAHPRLIDRYDTNIVHVRTVQNLLRWLQVDVHLRELVAGKLRPRFDKTRISHRPDFNEGQNLAVERAMQMQDYLLVQGPPGTGKTSVIAEIVKRLCGQGQRVLLAAFTNQAVDNMLKRLDAEGFHDYVRLGHDRSVHVDVQERLLKHLVERRGPFSSADILMQVPLADKSAVDAINRPLHSFKSAVDAINRVPTPSHTFSPDAHNLASQSMVREILREAAVVASTTATWSSEKYSPQFSNGTAGGSEDLPWQFDVAIIDEASQLTVPAILGALRLAKRFILVGDEKQLPPLVLSKEAAEKGLADSLFSYLKHLDDDYTKDHAMEDSACVSLGVQYRMNRWICNFSSRVFYEGKLEADPSVAKRVLDVATIGPVLVTEAPAVHQAIQPAYPLVFLDVRSEEGSEGIKRSDAEARVVREVVRGLLVRGIKQEDIGIIAPYRAQVANLRRHLFSDDVASGWQALKSDTPMSIDTVDRFQGGERMVIIISFATSQVPEIESPLREFLTNPNRLNVALTRAQRKLILVGCAPALEGLPYFSRLLAYCRSMKTVMG